MTVTRTDDPPELVMERTFAAPRALVWRAFTEPERVARWWAPRPWTTPICQIDLRPGGEWRYCMRGPNGEESWGKAVYVEIVPPERLVFTDFFTDADGNRNDALPTMTETITFAEQDGATTVTFRSRYASVADLERVMAMGMVEGFGMALDQLAEELAAA
jgi:uncharacterized protein YndB with AHSA1/START domain